MATSSKDAREAREAKLDELHDRLTVRSNSWFRVRIGPEHWSSRPGLGRSRSRTRSCFSSSIKRLMSWVWCRTRCRRIWPAICTGNSWVVRSPRQSRGIRFWRR